MTSVARTGPEGVARFEADPPDLMILDVALPLKNGFEVCFDVKRTPRGERTPILMMSAVFGETRSWTVTRRTACAPTTG